MNFEEVLANRRSIRDFDRREVPDEIIDQILAQALQSPSWSNTQPYMIAIAKGSTRDELAKELGALFDKANRLNQLPKPFGPLAVLLSGAMPTSDVKVPIEYPKDLQERRRDTGFGLYQLLGIDRKDKAGREAQMRKNFEFFGAPVVMFLFAHHGLGHYGTLDAGIFLQSLMLSATNFGLGTCAQGALAVWAKPVREKFDVPAQYKMLCGISLGYPSDHKVNQFKPARRTVPEIKLKPKIAGT